MTRRILVADNVPEYLDARIQTLDNYYDGAGIKVEFVRCETVEETREALESRWLHVAVVDKRMRDDTDKTDISGIELLRAANPCMGKVLLTAYPETETIRHAYRLTNGRFVASSDKSDVLTETIDMLFEEVIRLNEDLDIHYCGTNFIGMAGLIGDKPEGDAEVNSWAPELHDLFRKLFLNCNEITLHSIPPGHGRTVLCLVQRVQDGGQLVPVIVKCGPRDLIGQEVANYTNYVLGHIGQFKADIEGGTYEGWRETLRFAGIRYSIAADSLRRTHRFTDYYREHEAGDIAAVVDRLFQVTCRNWYTGQQPSVSPQPVATHYRQLLGLDSEMARDELKGEIDEICLRAQQVGFRGIETVGEELVFRFSDKHSVRLPNPLACLQMPETVSADGTLLQYTHGDLNGNNILVDHNDNPWIIDYERTGPGPVLRDFVELEGVIRWEQLDPHPLEQIFAFEKLLIDRMALEDELDPSPTGMQPDLVKALRTIQAVRRQAATAGVPEDIRHYFIGLFYHALRMVVHSGTTSPGQSRPPMSRKAHALLSAAMLCFRLNASGTWQGWPDDAHFHIG